MLLKNALLAFVASSFMATAFAASADCDPDKAEERWQAGQEAGIILGVSKVGGAPSFAVHAATWQQADYSTRTGMAKTFECLIAGEGNVLRKAHVINKGGKVLAVWDGVAQELDIR